MNGNKARLVVMVAAVSLFVALLPTLSTVLARPPALSSADAALPGVITYQGYLTDKSTGQPVADARYDMLFAIYDDDDPAVTTPLWSQNFAGIEGVQVHKGQFTVLLGSSVAPFPQDLFNGQNLWLGVRVGTDPEMEPRTRFTSVPYALTAETLRAQTAYISVPAAAFQPITDSLGYVFGDYGLFSGGSGAPDVFYAPVLLPHGSTVTKMTLYFIDNLGEDVTVELYRYDLVALQVYPMAEASSSDTPTGVGSNYDDSISYAQIDNASNAYYLRASFPAPVSDLQLRAVVIEYTTGGAH
jgi:hypothetical protein